MVEQANEGATGLKRWLNRISIVVLSEVEKVHGMIRIQNVASVEFREVHALLKSPAGRYLALVPVP